MKLDRETYHSYSEAMILRMLLSQYTCNGTGFEANWADVILSNTDKDIEHAVKVAKEAGAFMIELLDQDNKLIGQVIDDATLHPTIYC